MEKQEIVFMLESVFNEIGIDDGLFKNIDKIRSFHTPTRSDTYCTIVNGEVITYEIPQDHVIIIGYYTE